MRHPALAAIPLALAFAAPARADVNRCASADTDLMYKGTDIPEFGGDTGWFPGGSVAQLRLQAHVEGHTAVSASYTAKGCWDDKMQAGLTGKEGSGYLDVAYGADISLSGRLHASILGHSLDWEGNIPLPWVPEDLLLAGQKSFTPILATTTAGSVSDTTSKVKVLSTDVISNFITLGGISGGLYVDVQGQMTTSYRAKATSLNGSTVDSASDLVSFSTPSSGFHSTLSVPLSIDGVVKYQPKLIFGAGLDIEFLGIQVVKWQIATVTMSLPSIERNLKLEGDPAVLLLPELDGIGEGARMDFAGGPVQTLHVKNTGQSELELVAATTPSGIAVSPLTLAAGAEGDLRVSAADGALASDVMLTIQTNDPDRKTVAIELGIQNGGTDPGMPPPPPGEEGGCSAGGGQSGAALVLALGLVIVPLRRRRRC